MDVQRRDIAELTRVVTKLGLTLAKTNELLEKLVEQKEGK